MKIPRITISRRGRVILAVAILVLWVLVRQQISQMDERFFQPSLSGTKGLAFYMVGDYTGAARAYRAHFRELYQKERTAADPGWDALLRGDLQAAEEISRKALEKDASAIGPLLTLGEIALEKDAPDQALGIFERILETAPDQYDAHLLSSVAQARSGAYGKAIDSLNQALRTNRIESRITSFLRALQTMGNLARLPKEGKPLCLLAHYYRYLRVFDPSNGRIAVAYAKKAIASGDRPPDAHLTLGVIYAKEEKREKALNAFLKAIELDPKHAEALRWAAALYSSRGDILNQYRMIKAAFEAAPQDPFYTNHLDDVLVEKLGDIPQAISLHQRALENNPKNVRALERLGYAYGFIGDDERSLEYYRKAILLEPLNPSLYEGMGHSLNELGKAEEAITAYHKALSINPFRPAAHIGLAHIHNSKGRYREAVKEYEAAFTYGERNVNEFSQLCTLYHVVSEFERAAKCFQRVLAEDPRNAQAQHLLPYTLKNLPREK